MRWKDAGRRRRKRKKRKRFGGGFFWITGPVTGTARYLLLLGSSLDLLLSSPNATMIFPVQTLAALSLL
jgi:hypothetical protein